MNKRTTQFLMLVINKGIVVINKKMVRCRKTGPSAACCTYVNIMPFFNSLLRNVLEDEKKDEILHLIQAVSDYDTDRRDIPVVLLKKESQALVLRY